MENLHPILVHFPIALLSVYAVLECLRFKKLNASPAWFPIKAFLAIVGTLTSCAAFATGPGGNMAKAWAGFVKGQIRPLIEMHSTFAGITVFLFSILSLSYIIILLGKKYKLPDFVLKIGTYIQKPYMLVLLAVLGLIAVIVTGSLGGAIVYGPDIDPAVSVIYHLFF
jgi:uncharacterized membrane protein